MAEEVKGCACGCEEHDHEEVEIITLQFDGGEEIECEVLGVFDVDGKEYIALDPQDGTDDVFLYGFKDEEDSEEFELIDIEDDEEFNRVAAEFEKLTLEDE